MRSERSVTLTPTFMPSRSLKLATLFFAVVATACCPVMAEMSLMTASKALALSLQSPQPTETTILSIFGICITDLYWNFFIRAGATSFVYFSFILAISVVLLTARRRTFCRRGTFCRPRSCGRRGWACRIWGRPP